MLHNVRLLVPAGVALFWALHKLRPRPAASAEPPVDQEEGDEVDLQLPAPTKQQAGELFLPPAPPLKAPLLDVALPISVAAAWLALFQNASSLLSDFHQQLGDIEVSISPWRRQQEGVPRRVLRYTTPLRNPLGPRQALNTEVVEATALAAGGFCLTARCTSEGVPFGSSFANYVQWVVTPQGTHGCRVVVTGECRFHSPVWGPLKGQIERESAKGMAKAYRTLLRMLERQYGAAETVPEPAGGSSQAGARQRAVAAAGQQAGRPVVGGNEGLNISALLQGPQANPAALLATLVVMLLVWRLAFMHQALILQAARGVASAVRR